MSLIEQKKVKKIRKVRKVKNIEDSKPIRVFFQDLDYCYSIAGEHDNDVLKEESHKKSVYDYNYFAMLRGYPQTLEGLQQFYSDFTLWCKQLSVYNIHYTRYYGHNDAVLNTFYHYATNNLEYNIKDKDNETCGMDAIENITRTEFEYIEKCKNCGLMIFDKEYEGEEKQYFGYDYPAYYPHLLGSEHFKLQVPVKEGMQSKITSFDKELQYGIYHVKITCKITHDGETFDDPNFQKIFMFSDDEYYTHYSLNFCLKLKRDGKFNINLAILDTDEEFNCYIYPKSALLYTKDIFGNWFKQLVAIKNELKSQGHNNKLIKHLMSSAWGTLIRYNKKILRSEEEFKDYDLYKWEIHDITAIFKDGEFIDHFEIINMDEAYKNKLARLKPFLTSYGRKCAGELIINNDCLNELVRIHTDGFIFTQPIEFKNKVYCPIIDAKYTKTMTWYNVIFNNENRTDHTLII